jgi:hypothetical protein
MQEIARFEPLEVSGIPVAFTHASLGDGGSRS